MPIQHYPQETFTEQSTYHHPQLYQSTLEQTQSYGQGGLPVSTEYTSYYNYHNMSQATSHAADFHLEGYAGAPESTIPSL